MGECEWRECAPCMHAYTINIFVVFYLFLFYFISWRTFFAVGSVLFPLFLPLFREQFLPSSSSSAAAAAAGCVLFRSVALCVQFTLTHISEHRTECVYTQQHTILIFLNVVNDM